VASERSVLEDRVRDLAGEVPLQDLLAVPAAADILVTWCSQEAESITKELAAHSSRVVELRAKGAELADEARARESEADSARQLLEQLGAALQDMSTRRTAAVERIEGLLVDDSAPGVVMQADHDQIELSDIAGVIERATTQLVIVHPFSSTIPGE